MMAPRREVCEKLFVYENVKVYIKLEADEIACKALRNAESIFIVDFAAKEMMILLGSKEFVSSMAIGIKTIEAMVQSLKAMGWKPEVKHVTDEEESGKASEEKDSS